MNEIILRGLRPPFPKQIEVLDELFKPEPDRIKQIDLCCGRGFGKTYLSILTIIKALSLDGNQVGLFLEPDWPSIQEIFFPAWFEIVPEECYTLNQKKNCITWFNGSMLFYSVRAVTGSVERLRNKFRGRNLNWVIDDEAAIGCDNQQYANTLGAIRRKSDVRFYFTISTPLVGAYKRLITSEGHQLYRGTSRDNPYLPPNFVDNLIANMSADQVRREIDGEFISLDGKIWKTAKIEGSWPNGNRNDVHTSFDPSIPWYLFCDIGSATGSYIVVQAAKSMLLGKSLYHGPTWVCVADFCPNSDASATRAFTLLKQHFGTPTEIVAGADVDTANSVTGDTVAYHASEVWGNSVRITPSSERYYKKQIQYDRLNFGICDALGNRRLTVARDYVSLDQDSHRGLLNMFEEDEWPELDKRRPSDFLPKGKDNVVQHVRDALLMGAVEVMFRPDWLPSTTSAA